MGPARGNKHCVGTMRINRPIQRGRNRAVKAFISVQLISGKRWRREPDSWILCFSHRPLASRSRWCFWNSRLRVSRFRYQPRLRAFSRLFRRAFRDAILPRPAISPLILRCHSFLDWCPLGYTAYASRSSRSHDEQEMQAPEIEPGWDHAMEESAVFRGSSCLLESSSTLPPSGMRGLYSVLRSG